MNTEPPILEAVEVSKRYGEAIALDQVSLSVAEGEFLTLLGPSGSGKTSLLKIIVGFENATEGRVLLAGKDISLRAPADRGIGMVFQQYALFPHLSVADNIAYGLKRNKWPKADRERRVNEMLELVRLGEMADRFPAHLSGGQQQRVALARALAYDPAILLMDEPLGALDRLLRLEMEEEIRRIHRDLGTTVVYVTHDQQEALALSDRIAIMKDGHILGLDTPENLYFKPQNEFVASFFSAANLIPATKVRDGIDGEVVVQVGSKQFDCPAADQLGDDIVLAARQRSFRLAPVEGDVQVSGAVSDVLLFGDERQVIVEAQDLGRIVAALDARDSGRIKAGQPIDLYVAPGDMNAVAVTEPVAAGVST